MPVEDYYKSFSFRLMGVDVFFSTLSVFALLFILPFLLDFEELEPLKKAVADFDITDIYFSSDIRGELPTETDITIIQSVVPSRDGLKEISTKNYLQIVNAIRQYEPKVIGIDHKFDISPDDPLYPAVKGILNETPNVVLAKEFPVKEDKLLPDSVDSDSPVNDIRSGFNNYLIGEDRFANSVREFQTKLITSDDTIYHYGLELAKKFNPDAVDRFLARDNESERINFRGNLDKFKIISARDIVKGNFDEYDIRNKIVMIGYTGTNMATAEIEKLYFTPLNENTAGRTFPDMYKIILDANIVSMLLTDEYFEVMETWKTVTFAFLLCYINMMLFGYIGYRNPTLYEVTALITFMIETFGIGYLTVYLFQEYKLESNFTLAIVATALSIPFFELYTDTIKPFFRWTSKKLRK